MRTHISCPSPHSLSYWVSRVREREKNELAQPKREDVTDLSGRGMKERRGLSISLSLSLSLSCSLQRTQSRWQGEGSTLLKREKGEIPG